LFELSPIVWLWTGFIVFVLTMLAIDLFVLNREAHVVRVKEAMIWTGVCVALALLFNIAVYFIYKHNWLDIGSQFVESHAPLAGFNEGADAPSPHRIGLKAAGEFLTGWIIEYSLSLDNIFVIAVIFAHFRVPLQFQHRVLFWGILGALILRAVMILAGAALISRFEWIMYVFGAFLIFTAIKLLGSDEEPDIEKNLVLKWGRKLMPVTRGYHEQKFFVREAGRLMATPLFLVLLVVEATDVVFAVDSIPAIFGITRDPFLVFTSNVFAILGLRSLYFALSAMIRKFEYLNYSLAAILAFVGVKMILEQGGPAFLNDKLIAPLTGYNWVKVHVHTAVSLGFIILALTSGVVLSLRAARRHPEGPAPTPPAPEVVDEPPPPQP
jgi:tellurite resistance protein TerC